MSESENGSAVPDKKVCNSCGAESDSLKRCKSCKAVWCELSSLSKADVFCLKQRTNHLSYHVLDIGKILDCNGQCQKADWPNHKRLCKQISEKNSAGDSKPVESPKPAAASTEEKIDSPTKSKEETTAPIPAPPEIVDQKPEHEEILARGLEFQRNNDYEEAFGEFSKGIAKFPSNAKLFEARSLSALLTGRLDVAEKDALKAVELDPSSLKAKVRLLKVMVKKGILEKAIALADEILKIDPTNSQVRADAKSAHLNIKRMEAARKAFSEGNYREASNYTFKVTDESPGAREALLLRAECFMELGDFDEAYSLTTRILRDDDGDKSRDHNLLKMRAKILFAQERFDQTIKHLQEVLRENPDDTTAAKLLKKVKKLQRLKDEGDTNFKSSKYQDAYDSYTLCLTECEDVNGLTQFRAKLYCNRAGALSSLMRYEEAVKDCDSAIELDDKYIRAYTRRATCLRQLGGKERLERALADYEKVEQLQGERTAESRDNIKQTKRELKLAKRKNYYALLGITSNESAHTTEDIKKAYKRMALKYHPDRHTNSTEEEKKKAEATFKDVAEALQVLSDPEKRRLYDRGMDLEEIEQHSGGGGHAYHHNPFGGFGHGDIDPEFFAGGGHPFGGFGGGGFRSGGYPF